MKCLLHPFTKDADKIPLLEDISSDDELDLGDTEDLDEEDKEEDPFEGLSSIEQEELLRNTESMQIVIEKVSFRAYGTPLSAY